MPVNRSFTGHAFPDGADLIVAREFAALGLGEGLLERRVLLRAELQDREATAKDYGSSLTVPKNYSDFLQQVAVTRIRPLLSTLLLDSEYKAKAEQGNLTFLRTDRAFEKCMAEAHKRWSWVHKRLV